MTGILFADRAAQWTGDFAAAVPRQPQLGVAAGGLVLSAAALDLLHGPPHQLAGDALPSQAAVHIRVVDDVGATPQRERHLAHLLAALDGVYPVFLVDEFHFFIYGYSSRLCVFFLWSSSSCSMWSRLQFLTSVLFLRWMCCCFLNACCEMVTLMSFSIASSSCNF